MPTKLFFSLLTFNTYLTLVGLTELRMLKNELDPTRTL